METLYDLLGALPSDDADGLRAAFRQAVKGTHPDINPGDPDAGLKFREIVHANEILADSEQRAAYDHLLGLAGLEQEQAAKRAVAGKIYQLASGVMAVAALSAAAVGAYGLFLHLSANAISPATDVDLATNQQAAVALSATEQPQSAAPDATADGAATVIGPPLDITPNEAGAYFALGVAAYRNGDLNGALADFDKAIQLDPKFASAYIERGAVLYRMHRFDRAFADLSRGRRLTKTSRAAAVKKAQQAESRGAAKTSAPRRTAELTWQAAFPFLRRP